MFPLFSDENRLPDPRETPMDAVRVETTVEADGELNLTEAEPRAKDESWNERREKPV